MGAVYGQPIYGTTILSVRKDGVVAVVGDGQVTQGSQVLKPNATKVTPCLLASSPHVVCVMASVGCAQSLSYAHGARVAFLVWAA